MKQYLTFLFILISFISLFADGVLPVGSGTENDPYQVSTLDNLLWISSNSSSWESRFIQTVDIDASDTETWNEGEGFIPIGSGLPFTGYYNGQNYTIDGLFIYNMGINNGLFGVVEGAEFENIGLLNIEIVGGCNVGGLVGYIQTSSSGNICIINNCYVEGEISGWGNLGGLVGSGKSATITDSYTSCSIEGTNTSFSLGGIVGSIEEDFIIENCYTLGNISGGYNLGGIVGEGYNATITDSYTSCYIEGSSNSSDNLGGIAGTIGEDFTIENCYAIGNISAMGILGANNIGGIVGLNINSTMSNCYSTGDIYGGDHRYTSFLNQGGIVGWIVGTAIIENCYFLGSIVGDDKCSGLVGKVQIGIDCPTIQNSYYNYETVSINEEHKILLGALNNEQFNIWFENNLELEIDNYLSCDGENYLLSNENDFMQLLAFGQFDSLSFSLTNSINISNGNNLFIPYFSGNLNGNGNSISYDLLTNALYNYGLFGILNNSNIENIELLDISVSSTYGYQGATEPFDSGGGLAGTCHNSTINNVQIDGEIGSSEFHNNYMGGIVGRSYFSTITNCSVSGFCEGGNIGGLIGESINSSISNCHANNNKTGFSVGGLVERINNSAILNCYASGSINSSFGIEGGLVKLNENNSTIINSYYNFDDVLINGENIITVGALYDVLYNEWINNGLYLNIDNYLSSNEEDYLINDVNDFKMLLAFGQSPEYSFILTEDIDLVSETNFYIPYFAGKFNGNNKIIDNLNFNLWGVMGYGLFGHISNSIIENVILENINVESSGGCWIGGVAGYSDNYSAINNCSVSGSFSQSSVTGGIVGCNDNYSIINNCVNECDFLVGSIIGGITGLNKNSSSVNNCFSMGSITGLDRVGGLVGNNYGTISNSYSISSIAGDEFTIGGLVGKNYSDIVMINSFWDTQVSGQASSDGGTGKSTAEMQNIATYTSLETNGLDQAWDFIGNPFDDTNNEDYWSIEEGVNSGYPIFANAFVETTDEDVLPKPDICKLLGNYPNPFNPSTTIKFSIPNESKVSIEVFNIKGQKVKQLVSNQFSAGQHSVIWNGKDQNKNPVSTGVYFYKLNINNKTKGIKKCLMVK